MTTDNIIVSRNALGQMLGDLVDGNRMSAIAALRTILATAEKAELVARVDDLERGGRVRALALQLGLDDNLYAAPVASSEDAKDAARYRWLRESDFDIFGSSHTGTLTGSDLDAAIDAAMEKIASLEAKLAASSEDAKRYQELLYAVERKFPNETRHETALRYIREAETGSSAPASAAMKEEK